MDSLAASIRRGLPFVLSAAALAFLFWRFDLRETWGAIDARAAWIFLPTLLLYGTLTLALEAATLVRLVPTREFGFDGWTAMRVKAASYLIFILNYAVGAGALSVLLRRRAGIPLPDAAGVVMLIAALDLGLLVALGTLGLAFLGSDAPAVRVGVLAAAGAAMAGGLVLLRAPTSLGPLEPVRSLSVFRAARTTPLVGLIEVVLLRLLFVGLFLALAAATLFAFGITLPVADLIVNVAIVTLVSALPIAIAGLGTGQAAFVYFFRRWAEPETLLACSLLLSVGLITLRVAIGLAFAREYTREAIELAKQESA